MTEFVCENINTLDVDIDDRCFSEIADEMYYSDKSNIAVVGASASENTNLVLSFIKKYSQNYKHVFYTVYDKDKYVFYDKNSYLSVDCILKKSIVRPLVGKVINPVMYFEQCLDENCLVVVDSFSVLSVSPYMRHLAKSKCKLVVVFRNENVTIPDDFHTIRLQGSEEVKDIDVKISGLENNEKELLMTMCSLLYYLGSSTEIVSSKNGVFDKDSLRFYLESLADSVEKLVCLELVKIRKDGSFEISDDVFRYVFERLRPSTDNCKTLMSFLKKYADMEIENEAKDVYAKLCYKENADSTFIESDEFLDVYTYFADKDENSLLRIYNALLSKAFSKIGIDGENSYCEHLKMRNSAYYIRYLFENLRGNSALEIYKDCVDEPWFYPVEVLAKLDVIRIAVCLLRNLPGDLYQENKEIFGVLCSAMEELLENVSLVEDAEVKRCILDDCIRICFETFSYFSFIDREGNAFAKRFRCETTRIEYNAEKISDTDNAQSLFFGYSPLTVSLYAMFQRYLFEWLNLSVKDEPSYEESELSREIKLRQKLFEDISAEYHRITDGLDCFCDFYDKSRLDTLICDSINLQDIEKRISDNSRFELRGFDDATKTGAERYGRQIINTIRQSGNPYYLVKLVLYPDYPISDYCFKVLFDMGFVRAVAMNKYISNLSKQKLLLMILDMYNEYSDKEHRNRLLRELVGMLYSVVKPTETFESRLLTVVNSMYFENKTCCLEYNGDFADKMYEKFCLGKKLKTETSDSIISRAMYSYFKGEKSDISKPKLVNAFKAACCDYLTFDNNFSFEGIVSLCDKLLGSDEAQNLRNFCNTTILPLKKL